MVMVLLNVVMPVIDGDTANVIVAAIDCPVLSVAPCLSQLMVM
jgi:hypothetical protein